MVVEVRSYGRDGLIRALRSDRQADGGARVLHVFFGLTREECQVKARDLYDKLCRDEPEEPCGRAASRTRARAMLVYVPVAGLVTTVREWSQANRVRTERGLPQLVAWPMRLKFRTA